MSTKGGFLAWLGIMFLAGFTPLPFKVFTITSGVIAYNLPVFFFICLFTRGLRFFLVSYFTFLFGKKFGEFIESFFFPVPPDLMIVPMVVAKREDYLKIFLIATTGSVLGGLFGYMLGVFFLDASMVIIEFYGYEEKVFEMQDKMSTKGGFLAWLGIMFLAGFTPCLLKFLLLRVE